MRGPETWSALFLGMLVLSGCGLRRGAGLASLTAAWDSPSGLYRIQYDPEDERELPRLQRAMDEALPRLERWGALREPITLQVLPDHDSLEAAVKQPGMRWLRAWGRYDEVFIQNPSTWGLAGASPRQLTELLLHELTHSLMYQLASDRFGWSRKRIPLWFREGMASYTADQGYRWGSLEQLARYLERHPGMDPLSRPEEHYRDESNLVYGVAHHAFTFLVRRYGEQGVRDLLRDMKGDTDFPEAFEEALGVSSEAFVRDFTRYVKWRGFQGGRLLTRPLGDHPGASEPTHPP